MGAMVTEGEIMESYGIKVGITEVAKLESLEVATANHSVWASERRLVVALHGKCECNHAESLPVILLLPLSAHLYTLD